MSITGEQSFSANVKSEIIEKINNRQKADACLLGMLCCCNSLSDREIMFLTENRQVADFFAKNVCRVLEDEGAVEMTETERKADVTLFCLTVGDREQRIYLLSCFGIDESRRLTTEYLPKEKFYPQLIAGLFLASGSVNNPEKKYHMEFVMPTLELCNDLGLLLIDNYQILPKHIERKRTQIVYIKESENIIDILTLMGAGMSAIELMNVKIEKDMRNKINRTFNCEMANLDKTIKAGERQAEDIELIDSTMGLDSLPDNLREIAELRHDNPDISLKELGAMMDPPISRSGANHRLARIAEIAEKIRREKDRKNE